MPELPEVETVCRGLCPVMVGQEIKHIDIHRRDLRVPIPAKLQSVLKSQKIRALRRRGKYILGFLDNGQGFVLHLGMSGRIHIYESEYHYMRQKHDHVVFEMGNGAKIVFNDPRRFGMLYLIHQKNWQEEKPFSAMGPEPLGNDFSGPVLFEKLKGKKTAIKQALLDQRIVAGIGNIYACEALYRSGIHPLRESQSLSHDEAENLVNAIIDVLNRAIEAGGSSLKDYQKTDGSLGYFQTGFSVYDREGEICPTCRVNKKQAGCVERIQQAGRSTFFCTAVQR